MTHDKNFIEFDAFLDEAIFSLSLGLDCYLLSGDLKLLEELAMHPNSAPLLRAVVHVGTLGALWA